LQRSVSWCRVSQDFLASAILASLGGVATTSAWVMSKNYIMAGNSPIDQIHHSNNHIIQTSKDAFIQKVKAGYS
jgi:hypothetical protein